MRHFETDRFLTKLTESFFGSLAALLIGATCVHSLAASPISEGQVVTAQVESLDRFQAEQERLRRLLETKPKAYEDKFFDPSVAPAAPEEEAPTGQAAGFRGYLVETRLDTTRSDGGLGLRSTRDLGVRTEYRHETLNYGDFVAQMDLRNGNGELGGTFGPLGVVTERSSSRITLRNVGLPITTRLFADTAVGDISSEITDALARTYRLSLGTGTVRGVGTRLFDGNFDLRAGVGQRGGWAGGPYPGFQRSQGSLGWAGYSQRLSDSAYTGIQVARATGVPPSLFSLPVTAITDDVNSVAASVGSSGELASLGTYKARLMLVSSAVSRSLPGLRSKSQGIFVEGGLQTSRFRHEFGVYSAEPDLRFGDNILLSDNRGAYWRMDASSLRLNWGLGLTVEDANPRQESDRIATRALGVNANARYRLDQRNSIGTNFNWTFSKTRSDAGADVFEPLGGGTRSLNAAVFYQTQLFNRLGPTRFRATIHRNEVLVANDIPATGEEVEWEQDWIGGKFETLRPELVTTIGLARDRSTDLTETRPTAGVAFRVWPDADWSVGGSLHYTSRSGNLANSRGLAGTLFSEKVFPGGWRLGANVSLNQAVVNIAPSTLNVAQINRSNDRTASIYLRWEGASGTPYEGAGLRSAGTAGGGSLDGVVFFDANRDGEQQIGENGVPGVEVYLDGRYRVTTDRNGRFEFPLLGTGRHQITLTPETVPLPWGPSLDKAVSVDVPLRGQATARIPVVRTGD